jgi:hypothetical protein
MASAICSPRYFAPASTDRPSGHSPESRAACRNAAYAACRLRRSPPRAPACPAPAGACPRASCRTGSRFHPWIVAREVDERVKRLAQPHPAVQDHEHLRQHLFGIAVEHRARQPVLASELAVERGFRDARHLADRVDRHIGRVALPVCGHSDVEHLLGVHRPRSAARGFRVVIAHLLPFGILCLDGVSPIFVPVGNETRKQESDPCRHPKEPSSSRGPAAASEPRAVRAFADRGDRVWGTMRDTAGRNAAKKAELEAYSPRITHRRDGRDQ